MLMGKISRLRLHAVVEAPIVEHGVDSEELAVLQEPLPEFSTNHLSCAVRKPSSVSPTKHKSARKKV